MTKPVADLPAVVARGLLNKPRVGPADVSLAAPLGIVDVADKAIEWRPPECLLWVTSGKTQYEYMYSGLPPIADMARSAFPV